MSINQFVIDHPFSHQGAGLLSILPFLTNNVGECRSELYTFLENLDNDLLDNQARNLQALIRIFDEEFWCAIYRLEEIYETSDSEVEQVLALINIAYCHMRLNEDDEGCGIMMVPNETVGPRNFADFEALKRNLLARLETDETCEYRPIGEKISEVKEFHLSNHPNPFNPYTTIEFSVVVGLAPTHVLLEVFNIRGQRVRTLISEYMPSGNHSVVWDGRDDSGRPVGSGVYLYRLQAGEISETRRMLLLK
jgi:hypothetical protein